MRLRLAAVLASLLTLTLTSFAPHELRAEAAPPPPNVVVILVDDARRDDMSSLPRIASLIGDAGARFTHAYSPFPLCCPARATMLTGQYAHNHGVLGNEAPLGGYARFDDSHTLATWLNRDYTTGFIGKYLNEYTVADGRPPGWDRWMVPVGSVYDYRNTGWSINGQRETFPGYRTDTMGLLASRFIDTHADDGRPFFLFTSIVAPHAGNPVEADDPSVVHDTNLFPTPNVSNTYRNRLGKVANSNPAFNEPDVGDKPLRPAPLAGWEIDAINEVNGQRRESLLSAQDVVQDIVSALRANEQLSNTYVVFVSDNGYMLGDHRIRGGKVFPYEVTASVPMLIRGPGIPAGSRVRQSVGLHDLAPTILSMTRHGGANGGFPMDGVNLLPLIGNPGAWIKRPLVLEAGPKTVASSDYRFHGIVAWLDGKRWKYVERDTGKRELYNLRSDAAELTNRADRPAYASVQRRLRTLLRSYEWCAGRSCR